MGILVFKMKVLKIISRFCATVSTFGFSLMIILNTHTHSTASHLCILEPSEWESPPRVKGGKQRVKNV